jgi:hypothetical protein
LTSRAGDRHAKARHHPGFFRLVEPLAGDSSVLESRVERFPDGSFVEGGTVTYGRAGMVTFVTEGRGSVGPSPFPAGTTAR